MVCWTSVTKCCLIDMEYTVCYGVAFVPLLMFRYALFCVPSVSHSLLPFRQGKLPCQASSCNASPQLNHAWDNLSYQARCLLERSLQMQCRAYRNSQDLEGMKSATPGWKLPSLLFLHFSLLRVFSCALKDAESSSACELQD